jgi:Domain of unknown function (DUF6968)
MLIATRVLTVRDGETETKVPVRLFAPVHEGRSWGCRYEIDWPDRRKTVTARGVDSVQALWIALQMVGAELYTSAYHEAGTLVFDEPGRGYGFPVPANIRDMLVGDDARYD